MYAGSGVACTVDNVHCVSSLPLSCLQTPDLYMSYCH